MAHWQIETKNLLVEFLPFENKGFIQVSLYDKDRSMFANLTKIEVIYIPCNDENVKKLQSYKSISALVKYAIANQITDSASDAHSGSDSASVTSCPVPASTPAKSSEQGQDILSIAKRLKEIKEEINLLNGSAFQNATLTDAQHYQLLDVEMFIDDFIAPYSYREVL